MERTVPDSAPDPNSVPCRTAQHLNARHVEQVEVRGEQRQRDHGLVEIDADLIPDPRLVAHDLAGRGAAHCNLALPGPRFWTEKQARLAETSSTLSAPRFRRACCVGATTEKGTS